MVVCFASNKIQGYVVLLSFKFIKCGEDIINLLYLIKCGDDIKFLNQTLHIN